MYVYLVRILIIIFTIIVGCHLVTSVSSVLATRDIESMTNSDTLDTLDTSDTLDTLDTSDTSDTPNLNNACVQAVLYNKKRLDNIQKTINKVENPFDGRKNLTITQNTKDINLLSNSIKDQGNSLAGNITPDTASLV